MENTKKEFTQMSNLESQIAELKKQLDLQRIYVLQSAANDFSSEIAELASVIKGTFAKAKLEPTPFGFVVTAADFKKLTGTTEIRKLVNATKGLNQYANVDVTQHYASQYVYGPKEVKITLTKGFIQSVNNQYKQILASIEI